MAQSSLAKKLRMRPGQHALILNAPSGYIESLQDLPDGFEVSVRPSGKHGFVQLFVRNSTVYHDLIGSALDALEYDAVFWICYPKKSSKVESDLSRDVLWELTGDTGLRPVTQVSIDAVWSALRYRPSEQVGK
jgi:hypothetical protein